MLPVENSITEAKMRVSSSFTTAPIYNPVKGKGTGFPDSYCVTQSMSGCLNKVNTATIAKRERKPWKNMQFRL